VQWQVQAGGLQSSDKPISFNFDNNLTTGQKVAILKTAGGASAIVAGAFTGQPEVIAGGIIITADGIVLSLAELMGGDTSNIPSDKELMEQIMGGIKDNWPNGSSNETPCK